jgi:hypothetical protein
MRKFWMALVCLTFTLAVLGGPRLHPVRVGAPNSSPGELVTLPYANFDTWATTLVLTNVSDAPVPVPEFWADYPVAGPAMVVPAKKFVRVPGWPRTGGGIEDLEIPLDVTAAVEIRNPNGVVFRVDPMGAPVTPGDSVEWVGLHAEGEFRSLVLIGVKSEAAAIEVEAFNGDVSLGVLRDFVLERGVIIFWAPPGTTRITARHGSVVGPAPSGPFWGVAWIWHDPLLETVATIEPIYHFATE